MGDFTTIPLNKRFRFKSCDFFVCVEVATPHLESNSLILLLIAAHMSESHDSAADSDKCLSHGPRITCDESSTLQSLRCSGGTVCLSFPVRVALHQPQLSQPVIPVECVSAGDATRPCLTRWCGHKHAIVKCVCLCACVCVKERCE